MNACRTSILVVATLALFSGAIWLLSDDTSTTPAMEPAGGLAVAANSTSPATLLRTAANTEPSANPNVEAPRASTPRRAVPKRKWKLRVWGRIVSQDDEQSIAGAEIKFLLTDGEDERPRQLATLVTDESGEFSSEVEIDASWYDEESESLIIGVAPSVWAPGHSSEEYYQSVDLVEEADVEFQIELAPGADVTGYVFDSNGKPVQADVYFHLDGTDEVQSDSVDDDGFYQFYVSQGGVASVRARGHSAGTALVERVVIDVQTRSRVPDMFLAGSGAIGGVLVDPNGEPIAGHRVRLLAETLIGNLGGNTDEWNFALGDADSNVSAERGDGRLFGAQQTKGDGTFLFTGLRPGRYLLVAHSNSEGRRTETQRLLHVTGDLDVTLVLEVYRLVVTTESQRGLSAIHCGEWTGETSGKLGDASLRMLRAVSDSPATFEVEPNKTYLVGLDDGQPMFQTFTFGEPPPGPWHVRSGETEVSIEEGRYLTQVELASMQETGDLLVNIEDTSEPYSYGIQIHSISSEKRVTSGYIGRSNLPLLIVLAPGRYRVSVDSSGVGALRFSGSYPNLVKAADQPVESDYHVESDWREIEIHAGQTASLTFHFNEGGRLRVATPSADLPTQDFLIEIGVQFGGVLKFGLGEVNAEFELENAHGERTRSIRFAPPKLVDITASGSDTRNWRELDDPLPTGSYVLRWKDPDGEVHEAHFEIRAKERTSVVFESE